MTAAVPLLVADLLDRLYLGHAVRDWLTAGAALVLTYGALLVARRLLARRLERAAPRTATRADDLALALVHGTSKLFLLAAGVAAGRAVLADLSPPDVRVSAVPVLLARLALYVQLAAWGNIAVGFWVREQLRTKAEHDKSSLATLNLLGLLARGALWVVLLLVALDAFGVNITALVTGLGVAGVAVALAVQNVLGDLLASLSIALDKPFVVGDFIVVDQLMGTVESIGLKTTRLRSISGEQIVVANAELLKARIRNFQRQTERRVLFTLTFPLGTPPAVMARVPAIVREVVESQPQVRFDRSHFSAITDQALAVETVYFVLSAEYNLYMDTHQRINLALLERLAAADAALAVPTRAVVVRADPRADGRADGDGAAPPPAAAAGGA